MRSRERMAKWKRKREKKNEWQNNKLDSNISNGNGTQHNSFYELWLGKRSAKDKAIKTTERCECSHFLWHCLLCAMALSFFLLNFPVSFTISKHTVFKCAKVLLAFATFFGENFVARRMSQLLLWLRCPGNVEGILFNIVSENVSKFEWFYHFNFTFNYDWKFDIALKTTRKSIELGAQQWREIVELLQPVSHRWQSHGSHTVHVDFSIR